MLAVIDDNQVKKIHFGLIPDGNRRFLKNDTSKYNNTTESEINFEIHNTHVAVNNQYFLVIDYWKTQYFKFKSDFFDALNLCGTSHSVGIENIIDALSNFCCLADQTDNRMLEVLEAIQNAVWLRSKIGEISVFLMSPENFERTDNSVQNIETLLLRFIDEGVMDLLALHFDLSYVIVGTLKRCGEEFRAAIEALCSRNSSKRAARVNIIIDHDCAREEDFAVERRMIPVDLILRTGRRRRLSGFLPIASKYAEIVFSDLLFPELSMADVVSIVKDFLDTASERSFGK